MGIAAAYYLAKQNKNVLVIDQFSIPNSYGSHHGHTRILRLGYGNGGQYVPLAVEALQLWRDLEEETGKKLYEKTGALSLGHPQSNFVKETIESSIMYNLEHETMNAKEMMTRWPGISTPENYVGCYDPESGFLLSEECILAYKEQALSLGVTIMENEKVNQLNVVGDEVTVETQSGTFTAAKLIVTAGAWIPELVKTIELPIQPVRKTIGWFKPTEDRLYSDDFPCFVFDTETDGHYYGFPDFDGSGVKLGRMDKGQDIDPDTVDRTFGIYEDDEGDIRSFLENYMPKAAGKLLDGKVCIFSNTPDSDFIVDLHPDHPNIVLAGGFSGHGFKFASVIGSILSELAIDGETSRDIPYLKLDRFVKTST